ncbi:MAG: ABC transporter permease [Bacteroidetes bacterium]|nr:ABC transporter permease [Bacteroidota bacterium]
MLINFIKVAWRNLRKSKAYSFINIFGLASGLACCMLISVYLLHELNYDSYQKGAKDIYGVGTVFINNHKEQVSATTPAPLGKTLKKDYPQVEAYTHILPIRFFEAKTLVQYKPANAAPLSFYEESGFMADSNFFRMFTYNFIEGEPATALDQPNSIVLSEEIARKIFGSAPALNKQLHVSSGINGTYDFTVKGVFGPIDKPSHIDARFFLSFAGGGMENFMRSQDNDFATNNMFHTYVRLRPGSNPAELEAQFPAFIDKYAGKDLKAIGFEKRQYMVSLRDIHLRSDITLTVTPPASKTYLYILASIAVFTLLIACINFMNLATARSAKRSSEVGVRKVLGAVKGSLIGQFLGESVLMSFFAFLFAWVFTLLLLPVFGKVVDRHLTLVLPQDISLMLGFLGLALLAGLLAGLYPAFYLSSFQPAKVLKGKFSNSLAAISLRKGLVVFQFMISVTLIISTVVINDQMGYLRSKDLGFDKASQIVVPLRGDVAKEQASTLLNEFRRDGRVISAAATSYYPGIANPADNLLYRDDKSVADAKRTRQNFVDFDYLSTMGIKAVAGRIFSKEFPGDTLDRIILNESASKELGFASPAEAIGRKVRNNFRGTTTAFEIIGVVKDFHFEDLHLPITPYTFRLNRGNYNYIIVHARPGASGPLLASMGAAWHTINPSEPFEYSFLDEDFQKNYAADQRLSAMIRYFTIMAILISCLGLFGLASFSAEQRIREIGIRKVLGASVGGIVLLLSKDFLKLVGVAVLIASPLAWWLMSRWLQDFAYRTSISWGVFVVTILATLLITLFTISFQAIRASLANPVKSLKTE